MMQNEQVVELDESPCYVAFKWNEEYQHRSLCDTLHTLYLIQLSFAFIRNARINHRTVITNLIKWHKSDPENNKFDGDWLQNNNRRVTIDKLKQKGMIYERILFYKSNGLKHKYLYKDVLKEDLLHFYMYV